MVKLALAALLLLGIPRLASAQSAELAGDDPSPAFNMFGFEMSVGALPIHGADTLTLGIGLAVEHPVFKKTRVFADYDWLWLQRRDTRALDMSATDGMLPRPGDHGSGHRVSLGLRRELVGKSGRSSHLFVDGELGGSVALVNDNMTGVAVLPAGFAGLRVGYDLYSQRDDSPSATFESGVMLRAIAVGGGIGLSFGLGMAWGN